MAKITIILHDLRGGGAEKMMVRLANQLAADGDEVEMILIAQGGSNKPFLSDSVKLSELNCHRTLDAFGPLRRALKLSQPDGILAVLTHINVLVTLVCASLGWLSKLSVSERNAFSLDKKVNRSVVMRTTYFLAPFIYRLLPNPVIAVSQGVAQDLVDTTVVRTKDVVSAPNPVITQETLAAADSPPCHPWLQDKTLPTLVSVGRLTYQKGFDLLIAAFHQVETSLPCRLIIFGEGEDRRSLEGLIKQANLQDKVSLPGYTHNPIAEMRAADLYVLSSRFEGSPNALVEAMSVNTPVVAFDIPHGPKEILHDGEVASLVKNISEFALADAIRQALNITAKQKIAQLNRQHKAIECFFAEHAAKHYRSLILRDNSR
ncbi:MAG: glycosyltransferase [Paraglaciecola sp.]|nr:glycosyltransferase [Paraglaciecola sp.]